MARAKSSPKPPLKKGIRGEDEPRRGQNPGLPRALRIARRIVNPRGNRKGR